MVEVVEEQRYVLTVDGARVGVLDYTIDGEILVARHVEVVPSHEGQGLGGRLVREVLDEVRGSGRRLRPQCPFVVHFLRENPDYADLVEPAPTRSGGVS